MSEVGAAERDCEKEAQRRGLGIHLRWLRALLDLCELEAADVVAGSQCRASGAEKAGKGLLAQTESFRWTRNYASRAAALPILHGVRPFFHG